MSVVIVIVTCRQLYAGLVKELCFLCMIVNEKAPFCQKKRSDGNPILMDMDFDGYELILSSLWIGSCLKEIYFFRPVEFKEFISNSIILLATLSIQWQRWLERQCSLCWLYYCHSYTRWVPI